MAFHRSLTFAAIAVLFCTAIAPCLAHGEDAPGIPGEQMLAQFRRDPSVLFLSTTTAELRFETHAPSSVTVVCGNEQEQPRVYKSEGPERRHCIEIGQLRPQEVYSYHLVVEVDGKEHRSEKYTFDTTFNYAVASVDGSCAPDDKAAKLGEAIRRTVPVRKGYCLLAGDSMHELAFALVRQSDLIVIVLEDDPSQASAARQWLYERGVYGSRATVQTLQPNGRLPLRGNFANLVVADGSLSEVDELIRVLRPGSPALFVEKGRETPEASQIKSERVGDFRIVRKESLPGVGQWTHQYGTAANGASCGESLGGAAGTGDLAIQWLGRPGGDFGLDRNPRMPAPLSVDGRLFHQGMNRIVGLDAYNGAVLWNLDVPALRRVNIPRDCGNWCAATEALYCAVRNQLWEIDPQNGVGLRTMQLPEAADRRTHNWGYVACDEERIFGSSVKAGGVYIEYWTGEKWYDSQSTASTAMVCSDSLFALKRKDGKPAWTYRGGAVVNPTITVAHGRVYFAESRHEEATGARSGRVSCESLWKDLHLVALDAADGREVWRRQLDDVECAKVVFFGLADPKGVILVTSANNQYRIHRFNPEDGKLLWRALHRWPSDNHSGHMQHPVVVGNSLYLEPTGYNLADGKAIVDKIGGREGCHTYLGVANALIYRGQGRRVSMWSLEGRSVTSWPGLRPSCWLSMVPAGGMLLVPEAGGGCSCGRWLETSVGFAPWEVGLENDEKTGDER